MKRIYLILVIAVAILGSACSEWAIDSTNTGWTKFEEGDLDSARYYFDDALLWDASFADAYNGLGWCDLLSDDLSSSIGNFEYALSYDFSLVDASAGACLASTEEGYHSNAVSYADGVIDADDSYQFSHLSTVTIEDIRLAKAKSSAALGDFQTALEEVQVLSPGFDADPSTSQGQASILAKIEELVSQYGG